MNFAKKCKELRMKKAATQEQMATALNLSPQAISKWENGVTLPDITLLPELSVYFGVTIDELFDITDEKHLTRIQNMVSLQETIEDSDLEYAQICEITGDASGAVEAWKQYISILQEDWNTVEGAQIDRANRKIRELSRNI